MAHLNWQNLEGMSTPYILASLLNNGTTKAFEMFSMVAWSLWNHRNTVVWRGHHQTPKMVVQTASDQLVQWKKAQSNNNTLMRSHSEGATKWQKPQQGWFSCNVDVAVSSDRKTSLFGCLLRDANGEFVAGYGGAFLGDLDPKIAEAMAFREALSWVKGNDMANVVFELDSMLVIQAIRKKCQDRSYFGDIIDDCSCIFKDLRSSKVRFVRRSANMTAHNIAREAISMPDRREWTSVPSFLSIVISQDLINV